MSENSLLEYFRNSGFEDLILPNIPQEILNIFSLSQLKESYDKVLQGKKPVPPEGGEVPELNFKEDLQMLEDAVKKAQEASGLDDEQMKEAFRGLLEEKLGGGASENPEEKLTFSEHKNANIIKNASAGSWVIDYFLSALPIGEEVVALVYLIFVSSNHEAIDKFVGSFKSDKKPKVIKTITKFKKEDVISLLDVLKIEGKDIPPALNRVDQVMNYVVTIIIGLMAYHVIYFYIGLLDIEETKGILAKSKEEINKIGDELIAELVSSVFISALVSLVATPVAALAIQLKKAYKVKKISSRISKLIGLRSKIYKILKSKPAKLLLRISDRKSYDETSSTLDIRKSKSHVDNIRKKLGIKIKKAYFNNLLIKKLANFLEKNNLTEELRILKEEIL